MPTIVVWKVVQSLQTNEALIDTKGNPGRICQHHHQDMSVGVANKLLDGQISKTMSQDAVPNSTSSSVINTSVNVANDFRISRR
jgi:hypothetical protein